MDPAIVLTGLIEIYSHMARLICRAKNYFRECDFLTNYPNVLKCKKMEQN